MTKDLALTIEEWAPGHARWPELAGIMKSEGFGYYWRNAEYWSQFDHCFLIALRGEDIAGFLEYYRQPIGPESKCPPLDLNGNVLEEAKIKSFAVLEPFRRQGIGRALQESAIQRALRQGCHQLRSYSANEPAHRANYQLKLSMGFAAQPELRGDGDWGVNFIMPLSPNAHR
jgi:GNAT superfamily N-acetyltransferase